MSKSNAKFLLLVLKYTSSKPDISALADAINLTPAATSMRITRLKQKLEQSRFDGHDMHFLEKLIEYSGGKVDLKGVAEEMGMKVTAISMRMTRLRKKFGGGGERSGRKGTGKWFGGWKRETRLECEQKEFQFSQRNCPIAIIVSFRLAITPDAHGLIHQILQLGSTAVPCVDVFQLTPNVNAFRIISRTILLSIGFEIRLVTFVFHATINSIAINTVYHGSTPCQSQSSRKYA
jgi:hypothetical protein